MGRFTTHISMGLLAAAAALAGHGQPAFAQSANQVRIVVPFAAGGAADQSARIMAQAFTDRLGVNAIVENRAGAGGTLAATEVARSAPDGKTFFLGSNGPLVVNVALFAKLNYDPERDFTPIVGLVESPLLLVARNGIPAKSVAELVAYAKTRSDKPLTMASASTGNITHLAGEMISQKLGIKVTHVPFRGSAPAVTAVMSGDVDIMYDALPSVVEQARAGSLRPLAIANTKRLPDLPEVPTFDELGLDIGKVTAWFGLVGPAKLPDEIVRRYNETANAALSDPNVQKLIEGAKFSTIGGKPEEFGKFVRAESERWHPVVRSLGLKVE